MAYAELMAPVTRYAIAPANGSADGATVRPCASTNAEIVVPEVQLMNACKPFVAETNSLAAGELGNERIRTDSQQVCEWDD